MEKYNPQEVEKKWQAIWKKKKTWKTDLKKAKKPYFNLMMFPYPSAEGLHVGNVYAFCGSDIYGRFQRMQGNDVFEPIGFDSFGIHSENFAIKQGTHPKAQTEKNIENFRKQLSQMGALFDWEHEVVTSNPDYYKWTQWLFLQLYKAGLAYRAKAPVDWCPSCKTVLAAEQVINGKCERCSHEVVQKELEQWFFKITKYAEKLLKNLEKIDWSERTKLAQKNWVGKSEGAELKFKIKDSQFVIDVFTTRPDTLFGATYMVLAPEHELIEKLKPQIKNWSEIEKYRKLAQKKNELERTELAKEKTGVELKGVKAINPANKEEISVWIADYVLASYGTGAIMAVPAHDERDYDFARIYQLPMRNVIIPEPKEDIEAYVYPAFAPHLLKGETQKETDERWLEQEFLLIKDGKRCYSGSGIIANSDKFNGMSSEKAKQEITKFTKGKKVIKYHLRDWLISRQRYWGPPIPMIHCDKCGIVPVPEKDLPVELPNLKNFQPTGVDDESPLASVKSFVNVTCPKCKGKAKRETDVSDTFLDSAWYFFRYPSVDFHDKAFDKTLTKKWLPVDMYIGGQEHAVLHLMYARFITMALKDMGHISFDEPFNKFRAHGLVIKDGSKMSKSKGNVVNPDEYFKAYGADTLRMYLMFLGPFSEGGDWQDNGILGISRFLNRVWNAKTGSALEILQHQTIKKVTEDMEGLRYNTAIAALMEYFNETAVIDETLLLLLSPFAPHITAELWERSGYKGNMHEQAWPRYDAKKIIEKKIRLVLQINGKVRDVVEVDADISEKDAKELALQSEKMQKWLVDKKVKKIIVVPGKLVNIVV